MRNFIVEALIAVRNTLTVRSTVQSTDNNKPAPLSDEQRAAIQKRAIANVDGIYQVTPMRGTDQFVFSLTSFYPHANTPAEQNVEVMAGSLCIHLNRKFGAGTATFGATPQTSLLQIYVDKESVGKVTKELKELITHNIQNISSDAPIPPVTALLNAAASNPQPRPV